MLKKEGLLSGKKSAVIKDREHIWGILSHKPSIWANWADENKIKRMSFLGITKLNDCFWSWRQILNIRPDLLKLFDYKLGKGDKFFFWHDPWPGGISIKDRYPELNFRDADIPSKTRVNQVWRNNSWNLPPPIFKDDANAWDFIRENFKVNNDVEDQVNWKANKSGKFFVKSAFQLLCDDKDNVPWFSLVWFAGFIPRHAFILWLGLKCRIMTKDRLLSWGTISSDTCSLCNDKSETMDHLFFGCVYSDCIWKGVLVWLGIRRQINPWRREISWFVRRAKGRSEIAKKRRLSFAAAVYFIWRARNEAVFNNNVMNPLQTLEGIKSSVFVLDIASS
ncbi:uncharacterized protein LOC126668329 [Mercurialis annua]|uniref:uncharacterized protein LOC126668329 n=1 Tax=Mercurialis annua TaxID=3986 RepID=UPI00216032E2|nr:uncharacterized protein LOC126668329 [Mercurialis annua]